MGRLMIVEADRRLHRPTFINFGLASLVPITAKSFNMTANTTRRVPWTTIDNVPLLYTTCTALSVASVIYPARLTN
jgi:hypothetical protein